MLQRAPISAAIEAKLQPLSGFVTRGGRWRAIEQMQETELPAWFCVKDHEEVVHARDATSVAASVSRIFYEVHLYANVPEATSAQMTMDPLVDQVIQAFDPGPAPIEQQTLGGVVRSCRVAEGVDYDGGIFGDRTWAIVPLVVITP